MTKSAECPISPGMNGRESRECGLRQGTPVQSQAVWFEAHATGLRNYLGMICISGLVLAIDHWFGPIGVTLCFGALFLGAAAYGCVAPTLRVSAGPFEVGRLSGWRMCWLLPPVTLVGLLLAPYAPAITCLSSKYWPLCA